MSVLRRNGKQQPWIPDGIMVDSIKNGIRTDLMFVPDDPKECCNIPDKYRAAFVANKAIDKMIRTK